MKSVLFGMLGGRSFYSLRKFERKLVETVCRLWTGSVSPSKRALIAWDHLCFPKLSLLVV